MCNDFFPVLSILLSMSAFQSNNTATGLSIEGQELKGEKEVYMHNSFLLWKQEKLHK